MKARFSIVDRDHERNIVFLEDLHSHYGSRTITNDAEAVFAHWTHISGNDVRVVYRDTDGEWWEMYCEKNWPSQGMLFRPWYGAVWDRLSRVEQ